MKKILVSSIVAAALGFASLAGAAFMTNLTVGSTGADVAALQTWLIGKGFSIPSISSGAATPGYFGQQTKAAVIAYQASVGLPNTGFVGPLTRGILNGATPIAATPASLVVPFPCPAGFVVPAPWVCPGTTPVTPVTPTTPGTVVMDGTDGSLTVSLSSYASNVTIKKGETKDMIAVKLQATAAPVSITRFDVRMDKRPWLYFSKITLSDSSGNVIATKNISGQSDATEITVGSDYLVRFEGIVVTTTPGTDKILVVSGTVLATTDKLTSDVNVNVAVPTGSIRTVNGKGYTDSLGLSGTNFTAGTTGRLVTLSSSGNVANVLLRTSPSTPDTKILTTSTSGQTDGIILGAYDLKSENNASTINTLTFTLKDNSGNKAFSTIFKRVYLSVGGVNYQVDNVATSSVFSNLTIKLPKDVWTTVTLKADVADQDDFANGAMASTTITANNTNIVGIDDSFNTVTASGANIAATNDITFLQSGASITDVVATSVANDNGSSRPTSATVSFQFKFNNTGNTDLYISTSAATALVTATTSSLSTATTTLSVATVGATPATRPGDLVGSYYIIPSNQSRVFNYQGTLANAGTQAVQSAAITKIFFDDDTTGLQEFNVNFGLEKLLTNGVSL